MRRFLTLPSGLKRTDQSTNSLGSLSRSFSQFEYVSDDRLNDEQQAKLERLHGRLNILYEELDDLLIKEEQLVGLEYQNRRRIKLQEDEHNENKLPTHDQNDQQQTSLPTSGNIPTPPLTAKESKEICMTNGHSTGDDDNTSPKSDLSQTPETPEIDLPIDIQSEKSDLTDGHQSIHPSSPHSKDSQNGFMQTRSVATVRPLSNHFHLSTESSSPTAIKMVENESSPNEREQQLETKESDQHHLTKITLDSSSHPELLQRTQQLQALQQSLQDEQQNVRKLNAQHADMRFQLKDADQQRFQLERELHRMRVALEDSEQQKQRLMTQLQQSNSNSLLLQEQCQDLQSQLNEQQQELTQLQQSLQQCERARADLQNQSEQFRRDLSAEREKFIGFLMEESQAAEHRLQRQVEEKQKQMQQLRKQLIEARVEASSLQQRLGGRMAQLQQQNSLLIEQLAQLRQSLSERLDQATDSQRKQMIADYAMDADLQVNARQLTVGVERIQKMLLDAQARSAHKNSSDSMSLLEPQSEAQKQQNMQLQQLERVVMRNMRAVIEQQLDSRFERLEQMLASLKLEVIEMALQKDAQNNGVGGIGGNSWSRWAFGSDMNNNSNHHQQHISGQIKVVQKKMNELHSSVKTYLHTYFCRILMELQEQQLSQH